MEVSRPSHPPLASLFGPSLALVCSCLRASSLCCRLASSCLISDLSLAVLSCCSPELLCRVDGSWGAGPPSLWLACESGSLRGVRDPSGPPPAGVRSLFHPPSWYRLSPASPSPHFGETGSKALKGGNPEGLGGVRLLFSPLEYVPLPSF